MTENVDRVNTKTQDTMQTKIKKEMPLVSVIVPVYNAEKTIKTLLCSLKEQTYNNLQIICINDGSTDKTLDILQHIGSLDSRIEIINKENGGPASARNAGLNKAKGKYISFIDSDDNVDWKMFEKLVDIAETNEADVVIFGGTPEPIENTPEWIWKKMSPGKNIYEGEDAGKLALFYEYSSRPFLWLQFIRREILEQKPALRMSEDLDLGEDQLFQFMFFPRAKKVVVCDEKLYKYSWLHEGSLMWKYNNLRTEKFEKHLKIVEKVFQYWQQAQYEDAFGWLISWAVGFLYDDLMRFPLYARNAYSKRIVEIAHKYNQDLCMCNGQESVKAANIIEIAAQNLSFEDCFEQDIISLKSAINNKEEEIQRCLKSKTFRLGKLLTPLSKRLDKKSILPPQRKKN